MSENTPVQRRGALQRSLGISSAVLALGAGFTWWGTRRPSVTLARQQCADGSLARKVLLAYATRAGSTGEIGAAIAKQLCAEGFDAELREVSSVQGLDGYAAVVLGSAVRYGDWLPEMLAFMRAHAAALQQRPLALFTACNKAEDQSIASQAEMAAYVKAARAIALPQAHRFFAGKIDFKTLSFFEKLVVKMIGSPEGDFRDWPAIGAWAQSLVPLFKPAA
jgi:menaquinone-dependent protoporphyrinogen oxidase